MDQIRELAVERASIAINSLEAKYRTYLIKELEELKRCTANNDWKRAIKIAHNISGEAGSLGWPHAGSAAELMRFAIEEKTIDQRTIAANLCLDSLSLVINKKLSGETDEGAALINELTDMIKILSRDSEKEFGV